MSIYRCARCATRLYRFFPDLNCDPPLCLQAHLLSCQLSLQAALYAVCGDALDGAALRLQQRLAPFRRAVPSRHDWPEELRALAVHVTNQVRGRAEGRESDVKAAPSVLTYLCVFGLYHAYL